MRIVLVILTCFIFSIPSAMSTSIDMVSLKDLIKRVDFVGLVELSEWQSQCASENDSKFLDAHVVELWGGDPSSHILIDTQICDDLVEWADQYLFWGIRSSFDNGLRDEKRYRAISGLLSIYPRSFEPLVADFDYLALSRDNPIVRDSEMHISDEIIMFSTMNNQLYALIELDTVRYRIRTIIYGNEH